MYSAAGRIYRKGHSMKLSYKQYCDLRTIDKRGNLIELSKFKRENPDVSNRYREAFEKAYEKIAGARNRGRIGFADSTEITTKTIIENTTGIMDVNLKL